MTSLASIFVTGGLIFLACSLSACAAVIVVGYLGNRALQRQERERDELGPRRERRNHLQVIGGNRVSSSDRWSA
ncbi:MAG TPA: hypothetical protein VI039_13015 [Solirubrobacterales bacterium]